MMTPENTTGYTDEDLQGLNREWLDVAQSEHLQQDTDEYHHRCKSWCDEVSSR